MRWNADPKPNETHHLERALEAARALLSPRLVLLSLEIPAAESMPSFPRVSPDYVIDAFVGAGAQASVYAARHRESGRRCALRRDPDAALLFERRAGLRHPGIVEVHATFRDDAGHAWLVEDYVAGQDWEPASRATHLVEDARALLYALAFLHDHERTHGDVKASNVRLTASGEPVFVDFGLCRRFDEELRGGTLGNAAPELLGGRIDPRRVDLFALGTSLLAGLRGEAVDARWSYETRALEVALDAVNDEHEAMLRALCSPRSGERAAAASEVIALLPPTTRPLPAGDSWPLAGRSVELEAATRFLGPKDVHGIVCLVGARGSGRSRLAQAIATRSGIDARGNGCVQIESLSSSSLESLARNARRGALRAVVWTSDVAVRHALAAAYGEERVHVVELQNLESSAVGDLARWLPLEDVVEGGDLARVFERTDGHPESLVRALTERRWQDATDAEVWLALRGGSIEAADVPAKWAARLDADVRDGRVSRCPDGAWQLASAERRAAIVRSRSRHELVAVHRELVHQTAGHERSYHSACAGDAHATGLALQALRHELEVGDRELAAVGLEHWVAIQGRRAVVHHELAGLLRALVDSARLDLVARVLRRVPDDAPPSLLAVSAYFEGERGDLREARRRAAIALEKGADADIETRLDLARILQWTGELQEADRQLASAPQDDPRIAHLRILVLHRLGQSGAAEALARRALIELGDEELRLRIGILLNLALVLRQRGALEEQARVLHEAGALAESVGDLRNAAVAWINSSITRQELGQLREAQRLRRRALARATSAGLAQVRDVAAAGVAIGDVRLGAWPAAASALDETSATLERRGLHREARLCASWAAYARCAVLHDTGEPASGAISPETRERRRIWLGASSVIAKNLETDLASGRDADAAVHWSLGLAAQDAASVRERRLPMRTARRLLRAADRETRETILVRLHSRRNLLSGRVPDLARLRQLARIALPQPKIEALVAVVKAGRRATVPVATHRRDIAAMLRAARDSESPTTRLSAWTEAWLAGRSPKILAGRILSDVAALERVRASSEDEPTLPFWTDSLADLRAVASRGTREDRSPGDDRVRRGLLEVQRLLLDASGALEAGVGVDCLREILDSVIELVHGRRGRIVTRLREDRFECARVRSADGRMQDEDFDYSRSLIDEVLESGSARWTLNASDDPEWSMASSVVQFRLVSIACVPIRSGEEVMGALYVDNPLESGRFREDALEIIEAFALQVALGLTAARQRSALIAAKHELEGRLDEAERELAGMRDDHGMLWQSSAMESMMRQVRRFAPTDLPVHIHGETGVGKELVARKVHELSPRRKGPFVSENCSAIASELFESELFGHVAGAFTGATQDKVGLLRSASGGTLFLDEIGDLPLDHQARLLRVLQDGVVRPVGSETTVRVDLRLVTATHRDLAAMVADGSFREDLFYRVVIAKVDVPPLRARREDVALLATAFVRRAGGHQVILTDAARAALARYDWPGNVRQLESYIRSAVVLRRGDKVDLEDLPPLPTAMKTSAQVPSELPMRLEELEALAIRRALEQTRGNRNEAAHLLGISRSSVFSKIKKYGLNNSNPTDA